MAEYTERETIKAAMIHYGFKSPDMTVTEFVEDELPAVSVPQWISVKDRLPCCGNPVLVGNLSWRWVSIAQYHGVINRWELLSQVNPDIGITHWMLLPEPPKGDADNG